MRSRRSPALLAALALLLAPAAACSDDDPDATGSTSTAPSSTETTETTETTAPPLAPLDDQAPPAGANGIRVDADGTLWIADLEGGQIVAVDPATGALVARLGADAGVTTPDDLALDPDGRLWWTEFPAGAIGRIDDPTAPDATSEVVAEIGSGANPIAVDDEGRVFAGRAIQGTGIYELDPSDAAEPREVVADPGVINGFDVGPDGRVYAPVSDTGEVVAVDPASGAIEVVATGIALPVSVRWAPEGDLVVLSGAPATVTRVDPATGTAEPWATAATAVGDNMAFGPDGTLYVTGFDQPTVSAIAPDATVTEIALGTE
jgi:sugar lactone lactonase YvrE